MDLQVRELRLPFRTAFRHASAERSETSSLWATARTATATGHGESCPRPYVTGETIDSALAFCERHIASLAREVADVATLRAWMEQHRSEIDVHPAAWCALELALLDVLARESGVSVEALLGLPALAGTFRYSAVIGDSEPGTFAAMAERYRGHGFIDFKIKLSGDVARDTEKVRTLRDWNMPSLRVRADANNLWDDPETAIDFLGSVDGPLWAVEEPIAAHRYEELETIGQALGCRIILDESFVRVSQLPALSGARASTWIVNVRVSKMGGLQRSLEVVDALRAAGIGIIVGAQVGETSLLTRAALTVARYAGTSLVAQEGAFGTQLLEYDIVEPVLMFGAGGNLDVTGAAWATAPGFGLTLKQL
jgi:L-alanine-DL-glutamate epimerase-like enolase superfamily enzyme